MLDISDYYEGLDAPRVTDSKGGKGKKGSGDSFKPDKLQKALELAAGATDSVAYKVRFCKVCLQWCSPMIAEWHFNCFFVNKYDCHRNEKLFMHGD